jgi:hypothetical protein
VKRREFDAQLLEEYQKSGGAFANDALDAIEEKDGQIIVTLKSGRQVACDYLVWGRRCQQQGQKVSESAGGPRFPVDGTVWAEVA